ncbi:hypothetical protein N7462_007204 [Penicillium macrosclerotiorum]|uniref:uncharacterized protein n=1 Tax=Penicillium macrosclerotiorum TaxID=303699 RepID=UPI002546C349|nr:uncharacterized protein N7462_007204 [Penicillium macrosclerotiorum]KAJ5678960.1 hypothetical protein N7462_007204 [Penicillium macrosclerotiorum]
MGLIKTGLILAGGYGLIKAASKATNDYEVKKQKRQNQQQYKFQSQPQYQQQYPIHNPQMGCTCGNQTNDAQSQPQWRSPPEPQSNYENHSNNNKNFVSPTHLRSIQDSQSNHGGYINTPPPSYKQIYLFEKQGGQPGSAHEY